MGNDMELKRILLGSDHTGVSLRKELGEYLHNHGYMVKDVGISLEAHYGSKISRKKNHYNTQ